MNALTNPAPAGRTHVNGWFLVGLLVVAVVIALGSFIYGSLAGSEFEGSDGQAEGTVSEVAPTYEPWFEPILPDLPGEVESGMFALQAGIGGGIVGYGIGVLRTRSRQRRENLVVADIVSTRTQPPGDE